MSRKVYIGNAFSLQMIDVSEKIEITSSPLEIERIKTLVKEVDVISCIGHEDTAKVVSSLLDVEIPAQRISVKLDEDDILIVAQLIGGRLPEGATTLPKGFSIVFLEIRVSKKKMKEG